MEPYSQPFAEFNDHNLQLLYYLVLRVTGLLALFLLMVLGSLAWLWLDRAHAGDGECGKTWRRRCAARPGVVAPPLGFLLRLCAAASGLLLGIAVWFFLSGGRR